MVGECFEVIKQELVLSIHCAKCAVRHDSYYETVALGTALKILSKA